MDEPGWYARPVLFVADVDVARAHWLALGFREAWRHAEGERLTTLQVERAGCELILQRDAARAGGGRVFVSLERGATARLAAEWAASGAAVEAAHWGMPVRVVRDPDGNELLLFDDDLAGA